MMPGQFIRTACMALAAGLVFASGASKAVMINEVRISEPGADSNNFWELAGAPNESLAGLSLIVISGEFNPGLINNVYDLNSFSIPSDGYFLAHQTDASAEITTGDDYFSTPVNFLLVSGLSAAVVVGNDIDTNNDGTPDSTFWTSVIDAVFLIDGDLVTDVAYGGATSVGPDGIFPPAHAYRFPDGNGAWQVGSFGDLSMDTPGVANVPEPTTLALMGLGLAGIGYGRRRRKKAA